MKFWANNLKKRVQLDPGEYFLHLPAEDRWEMKNQIHMTLFWKEHFSKK